MRPLDGSLSAACRDLQTKHGDRWVEAAAEACTPADHRGLAAITCPWLRERAARLLGALRGILPTGRGLVSLSIRAGAELCGESFPSGREVYTVLHRAGVEDRRLSTPFREALRALPGVFELVAEAQTGVHARIYQVRLPGAPIAPTGPECPRPGSVLAAVEALRAEHRGRWRAVALRACPQGLRGLESDWLRDRARTLAGVLRLAFCPHTPVRIEPEVGIALCGLRPPEARPLARIVEALIGGGVLAPFGSDGLTFVLQPDA